jgi:hypothetical protein
MISDGIAMPIEDWNDFLLMGFLQREIIEVDDGTVAEIQGKVGSCTAGASCISSEDITTCGGSPEEGWSTGSASDQQDQDTGKGNGTAETGTSGSAGEEDVPDDLNEQLSWIAVDGAKVGIMVADVFPSSTNGEEVAVTGSGVNSSWTYDQSDLTDYNASTGQAWYQFSDGSYRVTYRTGDEWAMYGTLCTSSTEASDLCHRNTDGSYALCFESWQDSISPLEEESCRQME